MGCNQMGLIFVIQRPTYLRRTMRLHGRAHLHEQPAVTFRGDESKAQKRAALANISLSFAPTLAAQHSFAGGNTQGGHVPSRGSLRAQQTQECWVWLARGLSAYSRRGQTRYFQLGPTRMSQGYSSFLQMILGVHS